MQIDIGEGVVGKQDGPGPIIYWLPRAPRIARYEKLVVILFPCYTYVCSVMPCNFGKPGFDVKTKKVLIRLLPYFDMHMIWEEDSLETRWAYSDN